MSFRWPRAFSLFVAATVLLLKHFFSAKLLQFLLVRMPLGPVSVCSVAELLRHYQESPRNSSLTRQRNRLFYLLLTPAGFCCYCEFSALNSRIKYKDIHTYLHTKQFLCCCSFCQRTLTETIIKPQWKEMLLEVKSPEGRVSHIHN